jgi:hypothetical protein
MKILCCLLVCLLALACSSETQESNTETAADNTHAADADHSHAAETAVADQAVELAVRNVTCGCSLEEVGHCGNYVEIGSKYLEIANGADMGLGGMEWCGKSGVQAETAGEIKDGKFVATTVAVK